MLVGWVNLLRRPSTKRNDFASVDARNYANDPKNYEMITSPPTTYVTPKTPDPLITSQRPEHEEAVVSPRPQSPPSPSSQYTNDYFNKEVGSRSHQLSFSPPPPEADYKIPKLSFSTPRPPGAGRSFSSKDNHERRVQQPQPQSQTGRMTSPGRSFSPTATTGRESGGSTFSSAYEWDPTTTYAPPSTQVPSYSRPDAYHL